MDLFEKNIKDRIEESHIVFLTSSMNSNDVSDTIFKIMRWSSASNSTTINVYLCSSSYDFTSTISLYDVLSKISNPVSIFCIGSIGGFSLLYLALGERGKRYALKHTEFSLSEPYVVFGEGGKQQTEVEIATKEVTNERQLFEEILSKGLKKELTTVHEDVEKGKQFDALGAMEYGLIDEILEQKDE